jgi:hypothetical protein
MFSACCEIDTCQKSKSLPKTEKGADCVNASTKTCILREMTISMEILSMTAV